MYCSLYERRELILEGMQIECRENGRKLGEKEAEEEKETRKYAAIRAIWEKGRSASYCRNLSWGLFWQKKMGAGL